MYKIQCSYKAFLLIYVAIYIVNRQRVHYMNGFLFGYNYV